MKILLLGDYSSLHNYLKKGLVELGHEVTLLSNGDGWKKIPGADGEIYRSAKSQNLAKKVYSEYFEPIISHNDLKNFDVVQFINPIVYHTIINPIMIKRIFRDNKFISLVAAGYDTANYLAYKSKAFKYYPFDYDETAKEKYSTDTFSGKLIKKSCEFASKHSDIIIPSLYEYSVGYRNYNNLYKVIPFPIDVKEIPYAKNIVRDKIVFFHGLNREEAKGTPFIRKAFDILQNKFPNQVETVVAGHLPFKEYTELLNRANVIVDQCCSYGYGINACIAMAEGKVVMSGRKDETISAFDIDYCPIIEATPNVDDLVKKMSEIVLHKESIPQLGYESRKYVEDLHDNVKVAQLYIDAWKSAGANG